VAVQGPLQQLQRADVAASCGARADVYIDYAKQLSMEDLMGGNAKALGGNASHVRIPALRRHSVGTSLLFVVGGPGQRGFVAVVRATAWDTCCRPPPATSDSVGPKLLFVLKSNTT
jgi:hypothetical protein